VPERHPTVELEPAAFDGADSSARVAVSVLD
jgi:hypothetical protein